jgi:FkbM family methyltransferase
MPDTREKLATNIKKYNKTSVVELVPFGLSDRSKKTSMTDWGIGASAANVALGMAQEEDVVEEIELISIDDFVNENNLDVGVIKLDVEGLEYSAIKGALNTIKNQKPVLLIAVYHTVRDLLEIKPMLEELDLGYTFMLRHLAPYRHNFYEQDLGALATWEYMLIAH